VRIFGWLADPGTAYWRLTLPLAELARQGHDVMISERMPDCVRFGAEADVVVASRTCNPGPSGEFQRLASEARMLCVYETDDDLFTVTPDNTAHHYFAGDMHKQLVWTGVNECRVGEVAIDRQRHIRDNLAAAHLITTSTEHLAATLRQATDAPVVVLPNRVPRWLTEQPAPWEREPRDRIVVGHTGGSSHIRDFGECAKPLRSWLQRHGGNTEFHAIGYDSTSRVASIRGRTRHTRWTPSVEAYLRTIDFDIGLAPLRDTTFARSKSPLKLLEYGALGMPAVASPTGPYVAASPGALLCDRPGAWRSALDELVDPDRRHDLGQAGRQWARDNLVENHAHRWLDAYQAALYRRAEARTVPA
jgi:glycosyltransferase involved in cell wall biosynthesis